MSCWVNNYFPIPSFKGRANKKNTGTAAARALAEYENNRQFQEVYIYLTNLFLELFEWENLPDTCNQRALETVLYFQGCALFFRDDAVYAKTKYPVIDDIAGPYYWHTPVNLNGNLNIYYEHVGLTAYSYNYHKQFRIDNSVLIRNNKMMYPTYFTMIMYAEKIVEAMRAIDVTVENLKVPTIIACDEEQYTTAKALTVDRSNNLPAIFTSKFFRPDSIQVMPTGTNPQILADLWQHQHNIYNELLTRIGINNANTDKRERLNSDEVNSNNDLLDLSVRTFLQERQDACYRINKTYPDLNVSVKIREGVIEDGSSYFNAGGNASQQRAGNTVRL